MHATAVGSLITKMYEDGNKQASKQVLASLEVKPVQDPESCDAIVSKAINQMKDAEA